MIFKVRIITLGPKLFQLLYYVSLCSKFAFKDSSGGILKAFLSSITGRLSLSKDWIKPVGSKRIVNRERKKEKVAKFLKEVVEGQSLTFSNSLKRL